MHPEQHERRSMADPIQIPRSVLTPVTRRRGPRARYNVRWWAVAAVLFLLIYGSIYVLVGAVT